MPEWEILRALVAVFRGRLAALHRDQSGLLSLEAIAIAIVLGVVASALLAILLAKVRAGADKIQLPGN